MNLFSVFSVQKLGEQPSFSNEFIRILKKSTNRILEINLKTRCYFVRYLYVSLCLQCVYIVLAGIMVTSWIHTERTRHSGEKSVLFFWAFFFNFSLLDSGSLNNEKEQQTQIKNTYKMPFAEQQKHGNQSGNARARSDNLRARAPTRSRKDFNSTVNKV